MITLIPYLIVSLWGFFHPPKTLMPAIPDESLNPDFMIQLKAEGLDPVVLEKAYQGWKVLNRHHKLQKPEKLAIADFTLSANTPRLFILDLEKSELILKTLVAHGRNSGEEFARKFSNFSDSFMSSPGFYITGQPYIGKHGNSLKLKGIQPGLNDHAELRGIVLHGADYVSDTFIRQNGRLGRSLGCPAVPKDLNEDIINLLKNGSCLYIHAENIPELIL